MELQHQDVEEFKSACLTGDMKLVQQVAEANNFNHAFLALGIDPALEEKRPEVLSYLLENGAPAPKAAPFSLVLYGGSIAIFEILLKWGWDINSATEGPIGGQTILSTSKVLSDHSLLKWLLDHGADPNLGVSSDSAFGPSAPVQNSGQVLNMAARECSIESFDLLIERGAKLENSHPLISAATCKVDGPLIPMMAHLLDLSVDINATDGLDRPYSLGQTALHRAVYSQGIEKVRFLLSRGANTQIKDRMGKTAPYVLGDLIYSDEFREIRNSFEIHQKATVGENSSAEI